MFGAVTRNVVDHRRFCATFLAGLICVGSAFWAMIPAPALGDQTAGPGRPGVPVAITGSAQPLRVLPATGVDAAGVDAAGVSATRSYPQAAGTAKPTILGQSVVPRASTSPVSSQIAEETRTMRDVQSGTVYSVSIGFGLAVLALVVVGMALLAEKARRAQ